MPFLQLSCKYCIKIPLPDRQIGERYSECDSEKSVIATMILMLSIFGSIGVRNKLYFNYWAEQDILSIIEVQPFRDQNKGHISILGLL